MSVYFTTFSETIKNVLDVDVFRIDLRKIINLFPIKTQSTDAHMSSRAAPHKLYSVEILILRFF